LSLDEFIDKSCIQTQQNLLKDGVLDDVIQNNLISIVPKNQPKTYMSPKLTYNEKAQKIRNLLDSHNRRYTDRIVKKVNKRN
jgi:hypothetical protein